MQTRPTRPCRSAAIVLALMSSVALLAACDSGDQRSTGQQMGDTTATRDGQRAEGGADTREAGRGLTQAAGNAGAAVADTARDVAITAAVNTRLAGDDTLSALSINVDTNGGQVLLRGSAPDTAARNRATELARSVEGVTNVSNELNVQPKP